MRFLLAWTASGLLCVTTSQVSAQRPDLTGEWTLQADTTRRSVAATGDAAFRRGDMGSGLGSPLSVRQSADRLIVEFVFFSTYDLQPRLRYVYALDGSTSRNAVMIGHAASEQVSTVAWAGDTLVITTTFPAPPAAGRPVTTRVRQALSLDASGMLTIATTREGGTIRTTWTKR